MSVSFGVGVELNDIFEVETFAHVAVPDLVMELSAVAFPPVDL